MFAFFHDLEGFGAPSDWVGALYENMAGKAHLKEIKPIATAVLKNFLTSFGKRDSSDQSILKGFLNTTQWRQND